MKRKQVLLTKPKPVNKKGNVITAQLAGDILILNCYEDKILKKRYCMNVETYEYDAYTLESDEWEGRKLKTIYDKSGFGAYYTYISETEKTTDISTTDKDIINQALKADDNYYTGLRLVDRREDNYSTRKRERYLENRKNRITALMDQLHELPADFKEWIHRVSGDTDYVFYDKDSQKWSCTACGKQYDEKYLHRQDGTKGKIKHNDTAICPRCKKAVQAKKRQKSIDTWTRAAIMQNIDIHKGAIRHFDINIYYDAKGRHIYLSEAVRIFLLRDDKKFACKIYNNQDNRGNGSDRYFRTYWEESNPANRRMGLEYMYQNEEITAAMQGTVYETWSRDFTLLAAAGVKADYNKLMWTRSDPGLQRTIEYLVKGKFYNLATETSDRCGWGSYYGKLNRNGETIKKVFEIEDQQKINRIRLLDGGENVVIWMRYAEEYGNKISEQLLLWLHENSITPEDVRFSKEYMTVEKLMNYITRQQVESYKGKTAKAILSQYDDYIRMCIKQKKRMQDEMVYRPRELKRRHDEIVEEIRKEQMIEQMKRDKSQAQAAAKELRNKFPSAERILKEIKEKYEYTGEQYIITVPKSLTEIVLEGQALHHCAAATDRYFDRIQNRETYICFLRKAEEPKLPFYTIEIEPSGTIRQNRSFYDEEPDIKLIRPFLKEWQQVVKKRLTEKDKEYAKISAIKRAENIEDLKRKQNIRVLNGLMEDFLEAEAI